MSILKDYLFVSKGDFADFRDMSANITEEKIAIFVRESQLVEIRGFLGQELYAILQNDWNELTTEFDNPIYNDLMFGTDYINYAGVEVRFNGYASALIYFAYARFLLQQQMNVSRFGLESVQNEISEDVSSAQIRTKSKEALSVAIQYQKDCYSFLEANKETYPEFQNYETKNIKNTSFTFFKV